MRRREFITLLGGAAAWPVAARAQQPPTPVIGFLRPTRAADAGHLVAAVRQGLRESGYPSDKVAIESRWADGRQERLPKLAAELVALQVTAIVGSVEAALAAKAATTSIPIVFVTGADPVAAGLVSSISRPGGNITGVSFFDIPVIGKRLALLRELVPKAEIIAVLQDPNFSRISDRDPRNRGGSSALSDRKSLRSMRAANRKSMQPFRPWRSPVPVHCWWAQVPSLAVGVAN